MSDHELDFFAFDNEPEPKPVDNSEGPLQPPADVARLATSGSLPETGPRRPFSVEDDTQAILEGSRVEGASLARSKWKILLLGEPFPKAYSDGTVRMYAVQFNDFTMRPAIAVVADRDNSMPNRKGRTFDVIVTRHMDVRDGIGEGDFEAGLRTLASWAADTTHELGDHLNQGHLWSIIPRIHQSRKR